MSTNSIILDNSRLLEKYKDGRDISYEDLRRINELASIGLISKGLSLKREKITAKTTSLGLKFI